MMKKPVRDQFLVFGKPLMGQEELDEIADSVRSGWLGTGPKVARFEQEFAEYKGVEGKHIAAVNSCTAALHISLIAGGIGPGDEVVTTAMTFCATVNAIIHSGATPVLADIEANTMNIDPAAIEVAIGPKTRAILIVHFAGRPCNMDRIQQIANKHNLLLIEDCAHAIESEYRDQKAGTMGDFGCFSFYATKNLTTGEGGMVLSKNEDIIARSKVLALHGMSKDAWRRYGDEGHVHYLVTEAGFKYNMMDIQAAMGIHQLARLEKGWIRRREVWNYYQSELSGFGLGLPAEPEADTRHGYHLFPIRVNAETVGVQRDDFINRMLANNVGVGVHYLSIPEHPYYRERFGWVIDDYPEAVSLGRETLSIPLSAALSDSDCEDVVAAVRAALKTG